MGNFLKIGKKVKNLENGKTFRKSNILKVLFIFSQLKVHDDQKKPSLDLNLSIRQRSTSHQVHQLCRPLLVHTIRRVIQTCIKAAITPTQATLTPRRVQTITIIHIILNPIRMRRHQVTSIRLSSPRQEASIRAIHLTKTTIH